MKKKKIIFRACECIILLLGLAAIAHYIVIPLFDTSAENVESKVVQYQYEQADAEYALEDERIRFELDPLTTHITVTDKRTGYQWTSLPAAEEAGVLNAVRGQSATGMTTLSPDLERSVFEITYSSSVGNPTLFTSNQYSVVKGLYEVHKSDDESCVYVNYTVGNIDRTYMFPEAISEERWKMFTEKLSSSDVKALRGVYTNRLPAGKTREEILALYPDFETDSMYILRDTENKNKDLKVKTEQIFELAGYTQEDYDYDMSRVNRPKSSGTAVFNLTIRYSIENGDLLVEIPMDSIEYNPSYVLSSVRLLPNFGAGAKTDAGFMLIPDGSGGIINFNNGKLTQEPYYANVYGWDWARYRLEVNQETRVNYPVFGISREGGSFLCMIEDGAAYAGVYADIAGRAATNYNTVNATYRIIHGDKFNVSDRSNNAVYMYEVSPPEGRILQRYRFITGESYTDMAAAYREYVFQDNPTLAKDGSGVPLAIEIVGAIDKEEQVLGVPKNMPLALTTYSQAKDMISRLIGEGFTNMRVRYSGWFNDGMNQQILKDVSTIDRLGTEAELRDMLSYAKEQNVPVYLDGLTAFARDSGLLEGFIPFRDAARFTTREEVELYEYSTIWYGPQDWIDTYYLMTPALTVEMMRNLAEAARDYGAYGVSYRDAGGILSADYNPKARVTREESLAMQTEALIEARASGLGLMARQGNYYAAVLCDVITDIDFDGGEYGIVDAYVPFWPMALHGYVEYTGAGLNISDDYQELLLRSAEMGAGLSFTFIQSDAMRIQETLYSEYYGSDINLALAGVKEIYEKYDRELRHTFGMLMTNHYLAGDVSVTTYEDGTNVYVNFGYADAFIDGELIPARDYAVKGGAA